MSLPCIAHNAWKYKLGKGVELKNVCLKYYLFSREKECCSCMTAHHTHIHIHVLGLLEGTMVKTHACTKTTCKLHTKAPAPFSKRTMLLSTTALCNSVYFLFTWTCPLMCPCYMCADKWWFADSFFPTNFRFMPMWWCCHPHSSVISLHAFVSCSNRVSVQLL